MLTRGVPHDRKQCLLPAPRPAPRPLRIHMRVATEKAWLHLPDLTHRVDPTQRNSKPIANIPSRPHQRLPSNRSIRPAPLFDRCSNTPSRPRSSSDRVLTFLGHLNWGESINRSRLIRTSRAQLLPLQPCTMSGLPVFVLERRYISSADMSDEGCTGFV